MRTFCFYTLCVSLQAPCLLMPQRTPVSSLRLEHIKCMMCPAEWGRAWACACSSLGVPVSRPAAAAGPCAPAASQSPPAAESCVRRKGQLQEENP